MQTVLKFELEGEADPEAVESDIALALFAAECVYGRPRVRLEASYLVGSEGRDCVLRSDGEAGDAAARIFTGLTSVRMGDAAYSVHCLTGARDDS